MYENLRRHDPRYATAQDLRSVTCQGSSGTWGTTNVGTTAKPLDQLLDDGKDSKASDAIIRVVERPNPRPVWICVWGGSWEVAQAIWKVRTTRSPAELDRLLTKLRLHLVVKQDNTRQWLLASFPSLFVTSYRKRTTWACFETCMALIRNWRTWRGSTPTSAKDTARWALRIRKVDGTRNTQASKRGIHPHSCTWSVPCVGSTSPKNPTKRAGVKNSSAQMLPRIIGLTIKVGPRPSLAIEPKSKPISPTAQT